MTGDLTTQAGQLALWKRNYQDECGIPDTSANLHLPNGSISPRLSEIKDEIDAAEVYAREEAHWAPVFAQPGYPFTGH